MVLKVNMTPHAGRSVRNHTFRTPAVANSNIIWCHSSMEYARAIVRYDSKSTRTRTVRMLPYSGSDQRSIRCGTAFLSGSWFSGACHQLGTKKTAHQGVYGRVVEGSRLLICRGEIPIVGSIPTGHANFLFY